MDGEEFIEAPLESKKEFIFSIPLFAGIAQLPRERGQNKTPADDFLGICKQYEFRKRAILAFDGDTADGMYILWTGQLEGLDVTFDQRKEQVFTRETIYIPGDQIGEKWLLTPDQHPFMLRARKGGHYIYISHKDFIKFIKNHKRALRAIYPHLQRETQTEVYKTGLESYLNPQSRLLSVGNRETDQSEFIPEVMQDAQEAQDIRPIPSRVAQLIKLLPEEVVIEFTRRSIKILYFRLAATVILAILLFFVPFAILTGAEMGVGFATLIAGTIAVLPVLNFLIYLLDWNNAFFVVTTKRLILFERKVLQFRTEVSKIDINKVQSISTETASLIENILQVGTAAITTAAQDTVLLFNSIDDPKKIEAAISRVQDFNESLETSILRKSMRTAINTHFKVDSRIKEIKPPKGAPKPKSMYKQIQEAFVISEKGGAITYHRHPVALLRTIYRPFLLLVFWVVVAYVLIAFVNENIQQEPIYRLVAFFMWTIIIGWSAWEFEDWRNDTFQVTDQYVFDIDRLPLGFRENRKQAELNNVENVRTDQKGILQYIFNYGNVNIETAGTENYIVFENVRDPRSVQAQIFKKRDDYNKKLEKEKRQKLLDENTTLIEMYDEAKEQWRIKHYRQLPEIEDDHYDQLDEEFY